MGSHRRENHILFRPPSKMLRQCRRWKLPISVVLSATRYVECWKTSCYVRIFRGPYLALASSLLSADTAFVAQHLSRQFRRNKIYIVHCTIVLDVSSQNRQVERNRTNFIIVSTASYQNRDDNWNTCMIFIDRNVILISSRNRELLLYCISATSSWSIHM